MKVQVYNLQGESETTIELPKVFETPIRPDVIKTAVIAQQSHRLQPQGRDPMAGKKTTAVSMGTGFHLSRVPRLRGSNRAAFAPGTVGGRQTHPPKSEKNIYKKINKKEKLLAIRSAIAATADKNLVLLRGHMATAIQSFPLVVSDDIQSLNRTSEATEFFEKIGLFPDLERVNKSKKIRAGKGKTRGRRTRHAVGPLVVIHEDKGVRKAMRNFLGVDVVKTTSLNAELLAPGAALGRLTIWTVSALNNLDTIFA